MTSKLPQPPTDCISRVRFAPMKGSNLLLVSSWDSHVRLYDVASGMLAGMHRQGLAVLDCTFLGEDVSHSLSGGLDRRLLCFDFQRQHETVIGQHDEAIRCVEYHNPSQQVFTASWDRTLRGWDPRRQPATPSAAIRVGAKPFAMDVSSDKVLIGGSDRHIHIFDVRRLNSPLERRDASLRHQIRVVKVGIDQRSYASGSVEGRCAIEYIDPEENADRNMHSSAIGQKTQMEKQCTQSMPSPTILFTALSQVEAAMVAYAFGMAMQRKGFGA
eukprot:CAMPEP_0172688146 /NCGR_PEP_ID=MMETSP1074-20121228/22219_1 /TAXON_ID=2916 /ORGANISM="Ceratium fusus, Strain PA161109" /LENGTH=271 /DNA_ID=CAMNT_0013507743 /DNA_START=67 /DNA_END=883 /DNA_ORIENTATION=-